MSGLRAIYLLLTVVGTIVPLFNLYAWIGLNGVDFQTLALAWSPTAANAPLFWDLLISAVTLCIWILAETYVRKDYWVLLCIPATFAIGVSCGLPLFLFLRTRPIN